MAVWLYGSMTGWCIQQRLGEYFDLTLSHLHKLGGARVPASEPQNKVFLDSRHSQSARRVASINPTHLGVHSGFLKRSDF